LTLVTPVCLPQMAVSLDNRPFARFLYDAMMFDLLPYWAPAVAAGALVLLAFVFIEVCFG
jgi:hypothetical protein